MKCKTNKLFPSGIVSRFILIFLLINIFADIYVCKASTYEADTAVSQKQITSIKILEYPQSIDLLIQGNTILTYTSVKQPAPPGIILYFSKTSLETSESVFTPPNEIIHSVSASQLTQKGRTSKVKILLKRDASYEITREDKGVRVSFSKTLIASPYNERAADIVQPSENISFPMPDEQMPNASLDIPDSYQKATRLQSVYAAKFGDSLKVFVGADGMITNYKSFTIDSPPRIVFDIFNITSPYENEKIIPVNTKWVQQIRYFSYPDRVRVILETQKAYLNGFSGFPSENGLLIQMGEGADTDDRKFKTADYKTSPAPSASRLQSVYATQLNNSMMVTVRGNGAMNNYKSSIEHNPPRIIVDIYDVESAYTGEQSFPVDTQWVKNVSYHHSSGRIKVVIETRMPYLSQFSVRPDPNGLVVNVGTGTGIITAAKDTYKPETAIPEPAPIHQDISQTAPSYTEDYTTPAQINNIEFLSKDAGKSTLVLGTTRQVQYDIIKKDDKTLELKLFNTKIPAQRQLPLITNSFESAVDRIIPDKSSAQNAASIEIALREAVPYFVDQDENSIKINFEASSIPPAARTAVPKIQEPITTAQPPLISSSPQPSPRQTQPQFTSLPSILPEMTPQPAPQIPPAAALPLPGPGPGPDLNLDVIDDFVDEGPKYTGEKIALDFYETDIKNVFRILREISGKNFAIDKDVSGKVTLTLGQPVPWDQVLDLVLKMNKLGKSVEDNIIRIATRQTLDEEDKIRQDKRTAEMTFKDQQKKLEPLITEYLPVNYSNAKSEIEPHLAKLITKDRGSVSVDNRTNMVIITDTPDTIKRAKELIRKLDRVTPQVIIEARVVEASTNFSRAIGAQWNMGIGISEAVAALGDIDNVISDKIGVGPERGYDNLGGTYGYNMGMNVPAADTGSIGFSFSRIAGTPLLLNAKLMAMESNGEGKIISAPKIVTLDNKKATITQGLSYPYQTVDDGKVSTAFKNVDLKLEVEPHVTPDNRISMTVNITKNDIGAVISGEQSFTTKEATTELLVNDGDTVVIGGIIKEFENEGSEGLPGLSKIPLIGWLFKNRSEQYNKEELLIFITPRIVQLEQRTAQF
ncbi:Type IV pilus biogenesis and competence protein [Desulfonema limicola]|uniref:Type IV pilus biogenesis and competence protein n=1 Tax=Desulfonema limicola TaxID=45656 RepID=A0A975BE22_9BACT|nr:type IV pilus secretin PilQ [Desulfonema limicola]QTA83646.1 Type IV pilus biogenesis and competence protein [Desulfonema limicola]